MKTLIASAFVATAAFTGAATAMVEPGSAADVQIHRYAPDADLSALSNAEIASLLNVIHSGDSQSDIAGTVQSLLRRFN